MNFILERCALKVKTCFTNRFLGIVLSLLSSVCLATMMACNKAMPSFHAFEITFVRMIIQLTWSTLCLVVMRIDVKTPIMNKSNALLLAGRGLFGTIELLYGYLAVQLTAMGDASAFIFTSPIVVTILGFIFLKERPAIVDCIIVLVSVVGVFFIAQPKFLFETTHELTHNRILGLGSAVLSCLGMSFSIIVIKRMQEVHVMVVVFSFAVWGLGQSAITCSVINVWTIPKETTYWLLLGCSGTLGFLGQVTLTGALKFEKAGLVSMLTSFEVVLAFIYDAAVFQLSPSIWSLLGATLIVSGVVMASVKKLVTELKESQKTEDLGEEMKLLMMNPAGTNQNPG